MLEVVGEGGEHPVRIEELADHPDLIDTLAGWQWVALGETDPLP